MIRVGVFGLGTIGRRIAQALDEGIQGLAFIGATARDRAKAEEFLRSLAGKPPFLPQSQLVRDSDLVVEAANQAAVVHLAPEVLDAGKDLMLLSGGALVGRESWLTLAEERRCRILVPSGAIAGLDAVKGATVGRVDRVAMESRKAPLKWKGAPYITEHGIDLDAITAETVLFDGSAREACRAFPASTNILAALSLAGIGADRTSITIFATPGLEHNAHRLVVEGEFGSLQVSIENVASENPRTGRLAYLSAIAMLRQLGSNLQVGT